MIEKPVHTREPLEEPALFQSALVDWFLEAGRDYPWRRTTDPYAILVSELMLQQTQIATVLDRGFYQRWMDRFPGVDQLAEAPESEVLKYWEGLGYYNRARNLRRAARAVVGEHGGQFPESLEAILALPGVGRYTAGAVVSFAFDRPAPLVDGNVARVFARVFDHREAIDSTASQHQLWQWAEALVPRTRVREYNSALMEVGQRFCTKGTPDCPGCPIAAFCTTRDPAPLPLKKPPRETVAVSEHALLAIEGDRVLLEQESGSRRKGLWRLPLVSEERAREFAVLHRMKYAITHHRVDLVVHDASAGRTQEDLSECLSRLFHSEPEGSARHAWVEIESELPELAMPSPIRRAVNQALKARREATSFQLES